MRRQIARRATTSVSLFPFLAVLICTMGALIVLLVLLVQMARVQADTIAEDRSQEDEQQRAEQQRLHQEQDDYYWQQDILEQQRGELSTRLADSRRELAHLEDHIRRLEQNLHQLQAEARQLKQSEQSRSLNHESATTRLALIEAEIQAESERLEKAREEAAEHKQSFAIIPYQGPNGTQRRPIYIECRGDRIVIQPEGIVLGPKDFSGPLGPGNPLDAALRAISEHWNRVGGSSSGGRPYPLLIVRPDGPVAYSMARTAMASWDDEFGYELIDDQMELAFPPVDPTLQRLLSATVQTARHRQSMLAAAMPSRFDRAAPRDFAMDEPPDGFAGGEHSGTGRGNGTSQFGQSGTRGQGRGTGRQGFGDRASGSTLAGGTGTGTTRYGQGGRGEAAMGGFYQDGGYPGAPGQAGGNSGQHGAGTGQYAGGSSQAHGTGGGVGQSGEAEDHFGAGGQMAGPANQTQGRPGQFTGAPGTAGGSSGMAGSSSGTAGGGAGQNGGASAGACASCGPSGGAATQPLAGARGRDWALPKTAFGATGITRPILAECHPDRIVIRADRGSEFAHQIIRLDRPTKKSIDQVVTAIWTHTERWGMAVTGGYWKPVIRFEVFPQAEGRFWELKTLLEGSGLVIEQH